MYYLNRNFRKLTLFFQVFLQLTKSMVKDVNPIPCQQLQTKLTCIVVSWKSPWCWLFKVCSSFSLKSKGRARAKVNTSRPRRLATSVKTEKQKEIFKQLKCFFFLFQNSLLVLTLFCQLVSGILTSHFNFLFCREYWWRGMDNNLSVFFVIFDSSSSQGTINNLGNFK